jgi:hypothetical protein
MMVIIAYESEAYEITMLSVSPTNNFSTVYSVVYQNMIVERAT